MTLAKVTAKNDPPESTRRSSSSSIARVPQHSWLRLPSSFEQTFCRDVERQHYSNFGDAVVKLMPRAEPPKKSLRLHVRPSCDLVSNAGSNGIIYCRHPQCEGSSSCFKSTGGSVKLDYWQGKGPRQKVHRLDWFTSRSPDPFH